MNVEPENWMDEFMLFLYITLGFPAVIVGALSGIFGYTFIEGLPMYLISCLAANIYLLAATMREKWKLMEGSK